MSVEADRPYEGAGEHRAKKSLARRFIYETAISAVDIVFVLIGIAAPFLLSHELRNRISYEIIHSISSIGKLIRLYPYELPKYVETQDYSDFPLHVLSAVLFAAASLIVRNIILIPQRVGVRLGGFERQLAGFRAELSQGRKDANEQLALLRSEFGEAFYRGFYTFTAGNAVRSGFEAFDQGISAPELRGQAREIVFGFMAKSMAHIGESGLAIVNAKVSEYVNLLRQLLALPGLNVSATCVVRPYWFVSPEVATVSLAPREKAGHLPSFLHRQPRPVRIAVFDERVIAEILLTSYIDVVLLSKDSEDCPNCRKLKSKCQFHEQKREPFSSNQIPEIQWFEQKINDVENKSVDLYYTHIRHSGRHAIKKFEDRMLVDLGASMPLDVRFNFTNLSSGILWLTWGDKAEKLQKPKLRDWGDGQVFCVPEERSHDGKDHTLYRHLFARENGFFKNSLLVDSQIDKTEMLDYINVILRSHIFANFSKENRLLNDSRQKDLLADGMDKIVFEAMGVFTSNLGLRSLAEIYRDMVEHYVKNGRPSLEYIISHDKIHPGAPILVVNRDEAWQRLVSGAQE